MQDCVAPMQAVLCSILPEKEAVGKRPPSGLLGKKRQTLNPYTGEKETDLGAPEAGSPTRRQYKGLPRRLF